MIIYYVICKKLCKWGGVINQNATTHLDLHPVSNLLSLQSFLKKPGLGLVFLRDVIPAGIGSIVLSWRRGARGA